MKNRFTHLRRHISQEWGNCLCCAFYELDAESVDWRVKLFALRIAVEGLFAQYIGRYLCRIAGRHLALRTECYADVENGPHPSDIQQYCLCCHLQDYSDQ